MIASWAAIISCLVGGILMVVWIAGDRQNMILRMAGLALLVLGIFLFVVTRL
ncbi:hypothetical protein HKCCE2091_15510 [Rhodobacterales bacterium HKCCE2091]|nr:hypothetical protein [Rhodobacterales bacterium HKCCE2091]